MLRLSLVMVSTGFFSAVMFMMRDVIGGSFGSTALFRWNIATLVVAAICLASTALFCKEAIEAIREKRPVF